jgi:tetratricopeptide (TPR) repeat protein
LIRDAAPRLTQYPEVQYHLGVIYYTMEQVDEAKTALQMALKSTEVADWREDAKRRLANLESGAGKSAAETTADLEKAAKDNPRDVISLTRLGELYLKQGQTKQAADTFERVIKINPKSFSANLNLAELYAGPLNDKAKAMEYAKVARETSSSDPRAAQILGQLAFLSGNHTWSYSLLQEAYRNQPGNVQTASDFAWAAYSLGWVGEARQAMQVVLKAGSPDNLVNAAKWFTTMIDYYEKPQSLEKAEAQVGEVLKADPGFVPGLMVRGALENQRGQTKQATQTFETVLARYPQFIPAQRELAILYAADPAKEKTAYDMAMKARNSFPQDPALAKALGRLTFARKDYRSAVRYLSDALAAMPSDAEVLYYIGSSHLQLKDKAQAKSALQKAVAAGLKEPLLADAKKMLGSL